MGTILLNTDINSSKPVEIGWDTSVIEAENSEYALSDEDNEGQSSYSREEFLDALKKVSRKRTLPIGENIRDAIRSIKGR